VSKRRVGVTLSKELPEEELFLRYYFAVPESRRAEWVRLHLLYPGRVPLGKLKPVKSLEKLRLAKDEKTQGPTILLYVYLRYDMPDESDMLDRLHRAPRKRRSEVIRTRLVRSVASPAAAQDLAAPVAAEPAAQTERRPGARAMRGLMDLQDS
jgi:hypothetical protein